MKHNLSGQSRQSGVKWTMAETVQRKQADSGTHSVANMKANARVMKSITNIYSLFSIASYVFQLIF